MPFFPSKFPFGNPKDSTSWAHRVLENSRAALSTSSYPLHVASGVAVPFSSVESSTRHGSAQAISVLTHVAILSALLFLLATSTPKIQLQQPTFVGSDHNFHFFPPPELQTGKPSLGLRGGGSGDESEPARAGHLPPLSSIALASPRLPQTNQIDLPVPPAVFDPNAPAAVPIITTLGLIERGKDTDSAGAKGGRGIGNRPGDGVGDDDGTGAGIGDDPGNYANVVSPAACLYCPEPPYTDEARKAKLKGTVTVRVLIGVDGRAKRTQIVKGLGLGLDEQALQSIRAWKFVPARDARRQPIATWVTIETRFQLF
jgi:periplasmic protein TonB